MINKDSICTSINTDLGYLIKFDDKTYISCQKLGIDMELLKENVNLIKDGIPKCLGNNYLLAGSFILSNLKKSNWKANDIDIFVPTMPHTIGDPSMNYKVLYNSDSLIEYEYKNRIYQIIKCAEISPEFIFGSFDMSICRFGYTSDNNLVFPRNTFDDFTKNEMSYLYTNENSRKFNWRTLARTKKYIERGFTPKLIDKYNDTLKKFESIKDLESWEISYSHRLMSNYHSLV